LPHSLHRRRTDLPKHVHDLGFERCQPVALVSRRHGNKSPKHLGGYPLDGSLSTKSLGGRKLFVLITTGISLPTTACDGAHEMSQRQGESDTRGERQLTGQRDYGEEEQNA